MKYKHVMSELKGLLPMLLRIAAIILLSVLMVWAADSLEKSRALRVDLSFNNATTQSALTDRVLEGLQSPVHVYAVFSPRQEDWTLVGLLERYAAKSAQFTFSVESLARNPTLAHSISSSLDDSAVSSDCLIIHNKQTGRTRVLDAEDYIRQSYDIERGVFYISGLNYEKSLTEAIVYVSMDRVPTIQYLTGFGEVSGDTLASMRNLLFNYNYAMQPVDLMRGDQLDATQPLMILSPQKDIGEAALKQVDAYIRAGGALFITDDFGTSSDLANFKALYRGYGFVRKPGLVVANAQNTADYYGSPAMLMPYMQVSEITAALMAANQTTLILTGSVAFEPPAKGDSRLISQVVLESGPAYLRNTDDGSDSIEWQAGDERGTFPLALISDRAFEDGTHSKAFIIGNSSVFTDTWLHQNTYSSELLLSVIQYLDPGEPIQLAISPKDVIRPSLQSFNPAIIAAVLLLIPLSIVAAALLVLLPRRKL